MKENKLLKIVMESFGKEAGKIAVKLYVNERNRKVDDFKSFYDKQPDKKKQEIIRLLTEEK